MRRSNPLSALAEEIGTIFNIIMEAAINPKDEERFGKKAGIENKIGALLTVKRWLMRTRPVDNKEEEKVSNAWSERSHTFSG